MHMFSFEIYLYHYDNLKIVTYYLKITYKF